MNADLQMLCTEANQKCFAWEKKTFALGDAFQHCAKLKSFAAPELLDALKEHRVKISMPSAYHAPRFKVKEEK